MVLVTGCGADGVRLDEQSARDTVLTFVAAQQDGGRSRYVRPDRDAAAELARAVLALGTGRRADAERTAERHGYQVVDLQDGVALAPEDLADRRGWGLFVVRPQGLALAVEVPHPRADLRTEHLGAALADAVSARYLLVAGARRDAADSAADVAHQPSSVFAVVHQQLAEQGVPAVQLHGFAAASLPGTELVVSPGAAARSLLVERVAQQAIAAGFDVCEPEQRRCGRLEGRTNAQSRASADAGTAFLHLEVTRDVRRAGPREKRLVDLLARAVRP